uniref:Glycos_transf_1 n=1 Tax=uncultured Lactobacillus sp. TaxID=153152 RepID=A0A060BLC2_9LACO|nr:Glycos_transf_1 [uncultured Lactobacillus sp.]
MPSSFLLGDGPLLEETKNEVSKLGLTNNFILLGQKADTAPYYSAMDCFILPSLYEGLPVVSIEAQANGLPL